jgi:hypothetical protein
MKRYKQINESNLDEILNLYYQTDLYKKGGYSFGQILNPLKSALKQYERDSNTNHLKKFSKFTGLVKILFEEKNYKLYRGLFFIKEEGYTHFANFEEISKNKKFGDSKKIQSWTTSIEQAKSFAMGSTNWMDSTKLDKDFYKDNYFGIILEYKPSHNEILVDLNFIEENNLYKAGFSENEVIIFPNKKIFKVIKILES